MWGVWLKRLRFSAPIYASSRFKVFAQHFHPQRIAGDGRAAAATRAMAMFCAPARALQGCNGGIRTDCVHTHGHIALHQTIAEQQHGQGAAHGVEHPGERMRNGRANFASYPPPSMISSLKTVNNKEDETYTLPVKQEVQPIDGGDNKLCAYFGALLDNQDIDNSVDQPGKPGARKWTSWRLAAKGMVTTSPMAVSTQASSTMTNSFRLKI